MMISGRERIIIAVAAVLVAAVAVDRYLLTPLDDRRQALEAEKQRLLADLDKAQALVANKRKLAPKWHEMISGGLKSDPAEAERQVLHSVESWSREAGLNLTSLKPERVPEKRALQEITFQAAGTGTMNAVSRFLWRLETAKVPLRIRELQLGARREGTDDLTLQLRLSTLYQASASQTGDSQPAARPGATGETQ